MGCFASFVVLILTFLVITGLIGPAAALVGEWTEDWEAWHFWAAFIGAVGIFYGVTYLLGLWAEHSESKAAQQWLRDHPDCYVCGEQSSHQMITPVAAERVPVCDRHWGKSQAVGKAQALRRFPKSSDHIENCRQTTTYREGRVDPGTWRLKWRSDGKYALICSDPRHEVWIDEEDHFVDH